MKFEDTEIEQRVAFAKGAVVGAIACLIAACVLGLVFLMAGM